MQNKGRVVVAYLDGRRLKGYVNDFSPVRDHLFLFPEGTDPKPGERGIPVGFSEMKALFFVKDFAGDPSHKDLPIGSPRPGKKVEVTFPDGEKIVGFTVAYNPKNPGFFMQPVDEASNNEKIFVVNRNVKQVQVL
jgi:hypothetical protein